MAKCLYCYKELDDNQVDYHPACSRKIFDAVQAPQLPYVRTDLTQLAKEVIRSQTTLTGVQPKLSLDIHQGKSEEPQRFTIVGLWGRYILKPQTELFPHLPELEDVTMHLAEIAKMKTVPHSLIRFQDGELCYITKRIDRDKNGNKFPMEDMCQVSQRLTEHKYKGSYEQIAKLILQYSNIPILDLINFWEQVLFSWITGNADMHLKNFSLYSQHTGAYSLTPAYDMLSTTLVMPEDTEELALNLNGKKKKIKKQDFITAFQSTGLEDNVIGKIFLKFQKAYPKWINFIDESFLPEDMKVKYKELIANQLGKL